MMSLSDKTSEIQEKWNHIYKDADEAGKPASILTDYAHLLPAQGAALDLACGLGANAMFLAAKGLQVNAWDISRVAITGLKAAAACKNLSVDARVRDCEQFPPEIDSLDVLVVSNFLCRDILPELKNSLRPNGMIIYTTHTLERPDSVRGPGNPDYLLRPGELLDTFHDFRLHVYRDEGLAGDLQFGERGRASIIASRQP